MPAIAQADTPCRLVRMATVDANRDGSSHLFIPAELSGRKTKLMIDTGGVWSLIKAELADELHLPKRLRNGSSLIDAAGNSLREYVSVPALKLGDLKFGGATDFFIMPGYKGDLDNFGGTVGLNLLARFDLELDNEKGLVNLFHPDHCRGIGAYWSDEYVELKLINADGLPETRVQIAGESVRALIDTGATRTFLSANLAKRKFGLTPATPGVSPEGDLTLPSGKSVKTYSYTFKTLTITGFTFNDVEVVITDDNEDSLTLGMEELQHLHLYFAFKEKMLYATTADARR